MFVLGSWMRFDREQYAWKSDSSQLLSKGNMRVASNLFHVGVIAIFFGHFRGSADSALAGSSRMGVSDMQHQYLAIIAGAVFGGMGLIGGAMLWLRRMFNPRISATSRGADKLILTWLMVTLMLGLSTLPVSIGHAEHGNPGVMVALAEWVQSVIYLHPNPELLHSVDPIFRTHLFFGMTVFLLFPFTRLVHVWSVPLGYLGRSYQIVRTKRAALR